MKDSSNPIVKKTLTEIQIWENKLVKPTLLKKAGNYLGKPIEWAFNLLPDKAMGAVAKSIEGVFGMLLFAADYTFSDKAVLNKVSNNSGMEITTIDSLRNQNLEILKTSASSYISENNILASMQGFGCGLGGVGLIAADIPLLFSIAFRVIQQIGGTFGYDMNSPDEKRFIMQIIDLGSSVPTVGKVEAMLSKEALKDYVKKVTFQHMEKVAATKMGEKTIEEFAREALRVQGKRATKKAVEKMTTKITEDVAKNGAKAVAVTTARKTAKDIGENLTRKKLLQLIPILGGVVGAGFNFWFIWKVAETAYYSYLKRHIFDNYEIIE